MDMNNAWRLPEGVRGAEWRGAKGKNWDNYNSIINKILFKMKKSCPIEKKTN